MIFKITANKNVDICEDEEAEDKTKMQLKIKMKR